MTGAREDFDEALRSFVEREGLPLGFHDLARTQYVRLADALSARRSKGGPLVVGVCGAQGSGKSTLSDVLALRWRTQGLSCAVVSLDDLYLPREAREALAGEVHPLLRLRGPPGTHDVKLGLELFATLRRAGPDSRVALPRFDKASDTRRPVYGWDVHRGKADIILFEGWCMGARPEGAEALVAPVNALEANEDIDGVWRRFANDALAGPYQTLFGQIDVLVLLAVPDFDSVLRWRLLQERKLRARLERDGTKGGMSDEEVRRFVGVYERLTRHILAEMPARADMLMTLDCGHDVISVTGF